MPRLELHLLGNPAINLDGVPVEGFAIQKARALLVYLAVEERQTHARESLVGLLWPDVPEAAARTNLRQALANLREAIGDEQAQPPYLNTRRESLQFNADSDHWTDVEEFERAAGCLPGASAPSSGSLCDLRPAAGAGDRDLSRRLPDGVPPQGGRSLRGVVGDPARASAPPDGCGVVAPGGLLRVLRGPGAVAEHGGAPAGARSLDGRGPPRAHAPAGADRPPQRSAGPVRGLSARLAGGARSGSRPGDHAPARPDSGWTARSRRLRLRLARPTVCPSRPPPSSAGSESSPSCSNCWKTPDAGW